MKAIMILGGIVGFVVGAGFGFAASPDIPAATALWRACAAALAAAVLARWWSRIWLTSLKDALEQRRQVRPQPTLPAKPASK